MSNPVPRFPNLEYSWRMPVRCAAWKLAWWLMKNVTLRNHSRHQQAHAISTALGAYRPPLATGFLHQSNTTSGVNVTVKWQ